MTVWMWVVLAHLFYDFHWQGDFIGTMKAKYNLIMGVHCLTYALVISGTLHFLGLYSDWKFGVLTLSHYLIDMMKARISVPESWNADWNVDLLGWPLWVDQGLHLIVLWWVITQ